jgi:hypothetical protein
MADGWDGKSPKIYNTLKGVDLYGDPVYTNKYGYGDKYEMGTKFDYPDYTDSWPMPSPDDDMSVNSGRYPSDYGNQMVADGLQLQGRQNRLKLIRLIKRRQDATARVASIAYDAMLASCANEGQRTIVKKWRAEFIGLNRKGFPDFADYMRFWANKAQYMVDHT